VRDCRCNGYDCRVGNRGRRNRAGHDAIRHEASTRHTSGGPGPTASSGGARATRALGLIGIAWGAGLLASGPDIWRAVSGSGPTSSDRVALTALGGRHIVAGVTQVVAPTRFGRLLIAVDLLHAASMVGLAAVDPSRRRPALVSAALALAGATAGAAVRH
jgi:hypothetical protein